MGSGRVPLWLRWLAMGALVVATACSGSDDAAPDPDPAPDAATRETAGSGSAEELWSIDLDVVGQPVAAGDVAVVYTSEGEGLDLVGIDATTGEELWRHGASPGSVPPGISIEPAVVPGPDDDPVVAYFRPAGSDLRAEMVAIDATTGQDIATTEPVYAIDLPDTCDDGTDVCTRTTTEEGEPRARIRLDLETGTAVEEPEPLADYQRSIGSHGLTDLRTGDVEAIARVDGPRVLWATPVAEAFGPGWSTNGGWWFEFDAEDGLFVGSVAPPRPAATTPSFEIDLAVSTMVALDGADGSVVWSDEGSGAWCASSLAIPRALDAEDRAGPPIRCRVTGSALVDRQEEGPTFTDVTVTLEGYDRTTGETSWSLPVGDTPELLDGGGTSAVADARSTVLPTAEGILVVDLVRGTAREVGDGDRLACHSETVAFEYPDAWDPGDGSEPITERLDGTLVSACGPDLEAIDGPLTPALVEAVGTPVGGALVVALDGRLVGHPGP